MGQNQHSPGVIAKCTSEQLTGLERHCGAAVEAIPRDGRQVVLFGKFYERGPVGHTRRAIGDGRCLILIDRPSFTGQEQLPLGCDLTPQAL